MNKVIKGAMIFVAGVFGGFVTGCGFVGWKAIKSNDIREVIKNKIVELLFGEGVTVTRKRYPSRISYKSYYYDNRSKDDLVFDTRSRAEKVLNYMNEIIDKYGVVTVADMYDLADLAPTNYTDNLRGWTSLRNAKVVKVRDGFKIDLPRPLEVIRRYK